MGFFGKVSRLGVRREQSQYRGAYSKAQQSEWLRKRHATQYDD